MRPLLLVAALVLLPPASGPLKEIYRETQTPQLLLVSVDEEYALESLILDSMEPLLILTIRCQIATHLAA